MKTLLTLLAVSLFNFSFLIFNCSSAFSQTNESSYENEVVYNWHEKNSAVAFRYAALPGMGYIYCGQVNKGFAFMGSTYGALIGGYFLAIKSTSNSDLEFPSIILLAGGVVLYLYQLIDAPYAAQRVNSEYGVVMRKITIEPVFTANTFGIGAKFKIQ